MLAGLDRDTGIRDRGGDLEGMVRSNPKVTQLTGNSRLYRRWLKPSGSSIASSSPSKRTMFRRPSYTALQ